MIAFEIPGPVVGKQRPKFARVGAFTRTYTPEKTVAYENLVKHYAAEAMDKAAPWEMPVVLKIAVYRTVPASTSKKNRAAALAGTLRPANKPDCDNIAKAIADAMNGIVYKDDAQIVELSVVKRYGERDHAAVMVSPCR